MDWPFWVALGLPTAAAFAGVIALIYLLKRYDK